MPRTGRDQRRNRFGFFGQLVDVKGLHVLLEAVTLLRAEGYEDFFVEINGDNIAFASEARRALLQGFMSLEEARPPERRRVRMNGSYQAEEIGERMARIDWCVVPSIWREAFGLVISEAWMFKRPVIASNTGGPAERIRDDVDGLLFPVGDARALAETMRRACEEHGLYERLSAALPKPPARGEMISGYLQVYGA
jgi:glycosyltransferase involved in cell wall biosynthesis